MGTWAEDIETALENLGGVASLSDIYEEVKRVRPPPYPQKYKATIRGAIERNSSDSEAFSGNNLFYSAEGIGSGIWGLNKSIQYTPKAIDFNEQGNDSPIRVNQSAYRVLRDTKLARELKSLHNHCCQICGSYIDLPDGKRYSEAHHIKPLGAPHNGPDVAKNILVLCPNHHVQLDYGAIKIEEACLNTIQEHTLGKEFINYHNNEIYKQC